MMHTGENLPYRNLMNVANVISLLSMFLKLLVYKKKEIDYSLFEISKTYSILVRQYFCRCLEHFVVFIV